MLLVYADDSGNSWEITNDFFIDGPFSIYAGILIPQEKYFHLERQFYDLFRSLLKVRDWRLTELHANEIWRGNGIFSSVSLDKRKQYFEEFIQLIAKLSLSVVAGIEAKNKRLRTSESQSRQNTYSQYSFLHTLEHRLSEMNETGVIICDEGDRIRSLEKLLYLRTQWRYNPGADKRGISRLSKYKYETDSCFILDQMHFVSSGDSFFVQIIDHICFILQRVLTYTFLKNNNVIGHPANMDMVPVGTDSFKFFCERTNIYIGNYDKTTKDIMLTSMPLLTSNTATGEYVNPNMGIWFAK